MKVSMQYIKELFIGRYNRINYFFISHNENYLLTEVLQFGNGRPVSSTVGGLIVLHSAPQSKVIRVRRCSGFMLSLLADGVT